MVTDEIYFATGNPRKIEELRIVLDSCSKKINYIGVDVDEIKSDSIETIVRDKLQKTYAILQKPVLCTDGGIFIDCLNGFPGENSKQAAKKLGVRGLLTLVGESANRSATRRNCLGYFDGKEIKVLTTEIPCEISYEPKAQFPAYEIDQILIPLVAENKNRLTYAEMDVATRVLCTELPQFVGFIESL